MTWVSVCLAAMIYAITGSPSSGKTSIIKELERRGEHVVHEAATDMIMEKIGSGIFEPWKEESFALDILKLQLEREEEWLGREDRVFVDRGIFDGYAFARFLELGGTKTLARINKILNQIDLNRRYQAIFFIMPHSENFSTEQTAVRREDAEEAAQLEVATYAIYCRHDNFILVPGGMSPAERADFILGEEEVVRKGKN